MRFDEDIKKMNTPQIPDENASIHFAPFEKEYGSIKQIQELCPGVYEVVTGPSKNHSFFCGEYIVVVGDTPAVSPEAHAYGTPVPDAPDVLVYHSGEYFSKARWVIQYEVHKYLADHGLPLPPDKNRIPPWHKTPPPGQTGSNRNAQGDFYGNF